MTHKKIIIAFSIEKRIIDAEEQKKNIQLHLMGSGYMHIPTGNICVRVVIKN